MKTSLIIAAACGVIMASPLNAQGVSADSVPRGQRPPEGMCRVWVKGVPANQQPAPTDCANAVRNLPPNARVIFGVRPMRNNQWAPPASAPEPPPATPPAVHQQVMPQADPQGEPQSRPTRKKGNGRPPR